MPLRPSYILCTWTPRARHGSLITPHRPCGGSPAIFSWILHTCEITRPLRHERDLSDRDAAKDSSSCPRPRSRPNVRVRARERYSIIAPRRALLLFFVILSLREIPPGRDSSGKKRKTIKKEKRTKGKYRDIG